MGGEDRDNRARHLILDRKYIVQFAVVPLGPTMGARHSINELRRDADAITNPPNASFQYVARAQFPSDLPNIGRLVLVLDRKSTRLNSSHANISYAVFCLKKKTT